MFRTGKADDTNYLFDYMPVWKPDNITFFPVISGHSNQWDDTAGW